MSKKDSVASPYEVSKRVNYIIDLIEANHPRRKILDIIVNKYSVSLAQANKYYYKSIHRLKEAQEKEIEDKRQAIITSLEEDVKTTYDTYKKLLSKDKHRDAQQWFKLYQEALSNLRSLYPDALEPKSEASDLNVNIVYGVVDEEDGDDK